MLKPSDDQRDEFHDQEIVDWKRVRAAIEHENLFVNHRLTWLFMSQLFLFAFFAAVFVPWIKEEVKPIAQHYVPFVLGAISTLASQDMMLLTVPILSTC